MLFSENLNIIEFALFIYDFLLEPQITYWGFASWLSYIIIKITQQLISLQGVFSTKKTIINSLVFAFKFIMLVALLVFVRGGIPRYRYDFLTKIGWIKFLSLILAVFLSSLLLVYIM